MSNFDLLKEMSPNVRPELGVISAALSIDYSTIPAHMREGTTLYLEFGIKPGDFLTRILEGDILGAYRFADSINKNYIGAWCDWLINQCPASAHGRGLTVNDWIDHNGLWGDLKRRGYIK